MSTVNWLQILGCLRRVRFLHVMHNDKFNEPFIDLINRQFKEDGHVFVFSGGCAEPEFPIPKQSNVIVLRGPEELYILGFLIRMAPRIFFHSFLVHETLRYVTRFRTRLQKASWVIWGADLYGDKGVMDTPYFREKKATVQKLGALIVVAPGDLGIARQTYDFTGPGYYGLYRLPVNKPLLDNFPPPGTSGDLVIQINNSCDESALSVLEWLGRFRDKPLKVRTILSYGNLSVREKIVETGRKHFGERFTGITEFLPAARYAELVAGSHVLIMNQPRQQGLGNIYAFLYCGAKVYIRSNVTSWAFLRRRGFEIHDSSKLFEETFDSFTRFDPESARRNRLVAAEMLDDTYIGKLWGDIFSQRAQPIQVEAAAVN